MKKIESVSAAYLLIVISFFATRCSNGTNKDSKEKNSIHLIINSNTYSNKQHFLIHDGNLTKKPIYYGVAESKEFSPRFNLEKDGLYYFLRNNMPHPFSYIYLEKGGEYNLDIDNMGITKYIGSNQDLNEFLLNYSEFLNRFFEQNYFDKKELNENALKFIANNRNQMVQLFAKELEKNSSWLTKEIKLKLNRDFSFISNVMLLTLIRDVKKNKLTLNDLNMYFKESDFNNSDLAINNPYYAVASMAYFELKFKTQKKNKAKFYELLLNEGLTQDHAERLTIEYLIRSQLSDHDLTDLKLLVNHDNYYKYINLRQER